MDERKERILRAIIQDYIGSAEPVGSRTIARKYDLGVSPATIRNEMADLEMLGYLEHIHTSSGRIPSSKGYRFYVGISCRRRIWGRKTRRGLSAGIGSGCGALRRSSRRPHDLFPA